MPRRDTYIPLSHDDYDAALVRRPRRYGGEALLAADPDAMTLAKTLIRARGSLALVAKRLGYDNAQNFRRAFMQLEGVSPREWLRKHGGSVDSGQ